MASDSRFYQLELTHRQAVYGDIGSILKVEGIVVGGEGTQVVLLLPNSIYNPDVVSVMSTEDWSDFLQRSDNPEVLIMPAKAFHRKLRYEISGAVQQKVWVADGLKCYYCGRKMGDAQMTIDHFESLESGGKNDPSNYLSACRKCNKDKGSMPAQDWCNLKGFDYNEVLKYLSERKV